MSLAIEFEVPVDTSTFSAVQLQPGVAASLSWSALARWLRAHLVPFPRLIKEESTGFVVMGFHLQYLDEVSFFDCEAFRVRAALRVMRRAERCQLDLRFFSESQELATARLILCPVTIEDPLALGASPAPLSQRLLDRIPRGEVESASPARLVPARLSAVETTGEFIAEGSKDFMIHRHGTEVAEQWAWTHLPHIVEGARETLALGDRSERRHQLRRCLRSPLVRFDAEYSKPFFSFERGTVVTRAFALGDRLGLVHRLTSGAGSSLHSTVVEVF
ncbi:MAG: acyl-CoA thioesterase FadM [Myxococcota bacterium]